MAIINISIGDVGQEGERPRRNKIVTTDSLAVVTAVGYLNNRFLPRPLEQTDIFDIIYSYSTTSKTGTYSDFTCSINSVGVVTLIQNVESGNVLLPVTNNHIAAFNGTTGQIYDPLSGTISHLGSIAVGASGSAGTFISFPATAANGTLILAAANAGGAFNTTISNGTMGQSTVYTLPDILATTGGIVVSTAAIRLKSVAAAANAGGSATTTVTDAFATSGSSITANWATSANAVSIQKVTSGSGSFTVLSSGDPGASTLNYTIMK